MKKAKNGISACLLAFILCLSGHTSAQEHKDVFIKNPQSYLQEKPKSDDSSGKEKGGKFIENPVFYLTFSGSSEQYKTKLGSTLQGILTDECDFVEYYLRDFGKGKDLVIACYQKEKGRYRADWVMNLDNVCRAYAAKNSFLGIETSAYFVTELSRGEINSKRMGVKAAMVLTDKVSMYLKNNDNRCRFWKKFIQENYGPIGPAE